MSSKVGVRKKKPAKAPKTATSMALRPDVGEPSISDGINHFMKLPLEVRVAIWTFAAPPPSVINQRKGRVQGRRWFFERKGPIRGVPNVLYICKESRIEYVETGEEDETLERRRRAHPVYKLCFRNQTSKSGGAFMSMDTDSLWAEWYHVSESVRQRYGFKGYQLSSEYTGIVELSNLRCGLGHSLKHLVFTSIASGWNRMLMADLKILSDMFPALETLTILITEDEIRMLPSTPWEHSNLYTPEVDGQLDSTILYGWRQRVIQEVSALAQELPQTKLTHPGTKFPALKFRFEEQFITNENLN